MYAQVELHFTNVNHALSQVQALPGRSQRKKIECAFDDDLKGVYLAATKTTLIMYVHEFSKAMGMQRALFPDLFNFYMSTKQTNDTINNISSFWSSQLSSTILHLESDLDEMGWRGHLLDDLGRTIFRDIHFYSDEECVVL